MLLICSSHDGDGDGDDDGDGDGDDVDDHDDDDDDDEEKDDQGSMYDDDKREYFHWPGHCVTWPRVCAHVCTCAQSPLVVCVDLDGRVFSLLQPSACPLPL